MGQMVTVATPTDSRCDKTLKSRLKSRLKLQVQNSELPVEKLLGD